MKINILGDSITWGYTPFTGEQMKKSYPNMLKSRLVLEEMRNYGINSSTLTDDIRSYEPMCKRYKEMDDEADIVIVFGGTNDYGREDFEIELGNISDIHTKTIYGALRTLCRGIKEKYAHSKIIFITPLQRAYQDRGCKLHFATNFVNKRGYTLEEVAKAIIEVCKLEEIMVYDLYHDCDINRKEDCIRYIPDGLHPTEEYHLKLAEKMEKFLIENVLKEREQ